MLKNYTIVLGLVLSVCLSTACMDDRKHNSAKNKKTFSQMSDQAKTEAGHLEEDHEQPNKKMKLEVLLQQEKNLDSYLSVVGDKNIQQIVAQYLNKWDGKVKEYDCDRSVAGKVILNQKINKIIKSSTKDFFISHNTASQSESDIIYNLDLWDLSNINNIKHKTIRKTPIDYENIGIHNNNLYIIFFDRSDKSFYLDIYNILDNNKISRSNIHTSEFCDVASWITILVKNFIFMTRRNNNLKIVNISDSGNISSMKEYNNIIDENHYILEMVASNKYLIIWSSCLLSNSENKIIVFDCTNMENLRKISQSDNFQAYYNYTTDYILDLSLDAKYLVVVNLRNIFLYSLSDNKIEFLSKHQMDESIKSIKFSNDSKYLVSGYSDNTIKISDITNLERSELLYSPIGKKENAHQNLLINFSNDGSGLIFIGNNGNLNVITNLGLLLQNTNASDCIFCQNCNKAQSENNKLLTCARCGNVKYCDRECQLKDWADHKKSCKRNQN